MCNTFFFLSSIFIFFKEHERRVKEEKKKQELEQQKKRLRDVNFSKPQVNFDDIFKKQIPVIQKPSPSDSIQNKMADISEDTSSPRPPDNGVGGCGQGVESGPVGNALQCSVGGGSKGEEVGSGTNSNVITEPAPSTGIYHVHVYAPVLVCVHVYLL